MQIELEAWTEIINRNDIIKLEDREVITLENGFNGSLFSVAWSYLSNTLTIKTQPANETSGQEQPSQKVHGGQYLVTNFSKAGYRSLYLFKVEEEVRLEYIKTEGPKPSAKIIYQ